MSRSKFPVLRKSNFMVEIPAFSEEEEEDGLIKIEEDKRKVIVIEASKGCADLKKGDEVLMSAAALPVLVFSIEGKDYAVFREPDVEAYWR